MHQALEDGEYRTFGYICMGSISYNPKPNGGEGATGQLNCGTAIAGVIDTVRPAVCLNMDAVMCASVMACVYMYFE